MTSFKSYSQCQQDLFVWRLLGDKGTFLDIGASHPTELSNTWGLEQIGWHGWLMDIEHNLVESLRANRSKKNLVFEADATKFDWSGWIDETPNGRLDFSFLSLDIDEWTLAALKNMPLYYMRFDVITIEHDAYRHGDKLRVPEREILTKAGYVLVAPDVANKGTPDMPFEDWWTSPELADKAREILKTL